MFKKLCLTAAMVAAAATSFAGDLVINGSTTVLPVVQKATEAFAKTNPDVHIALSGGGSGNGVKALIDGLTNIAMSSRDIKGSEVKLAEQRGVKPYRSAGGGVGIWPGGHHGNPVHDPTHEQRQGGFARNHRNLQEVGGKDAPIVVVSRASSSGTFETWESLVMKGARVTPRALLQTSNGTVVQTVAKNVNAIGYIGIGYLDNQTKALTLGGKKATAEAAKTKEWPLSRELYFFTNGAPAGDAKAFTDFVVSPAGQKIVQETGFVPLK